MAKIRAGLPMLKRKYDTLRWRVCITTIKLAKRSASDYSLKAAMAPLKADFQTLYETDYLQWIENCRKIAVSGVCKCGLEKSD